MNIYANALLPLAGGIKSPWPFILIGVAIVLVIGFAIYNKIKKK